MMMCLLAVRALLSPRERRPATRLLTLAVFFGGLGPLTSLWWTGPDGIRPATAGACVVLTIACISAAAQHPSIGRMPQEFDDTGLAARRIILPASALFVPAMIIVLFGHRATPTEAVGGAISLTVLSFLAFIRLTTLITERVQAERALKHQVTHDPLTGLGNRAMVLEALERLLTPSPPLQPETFTLFFFDLDGFKAVNDTHGHRGGDVVLREIGKNLTAAFRQGDVIARYAGDEFVLIIPGLPNNEAIERTAERILSITTRPVTLPRGAVVNVGASLGIVHQLATDPPRDLLQMADLAMYEAKTTGNTWIIAPPSTGTRALSTTT